MPRHISRRQALGTLTQGGALLAGASLFPAAVQANPTPAAAPAPVPAFKPKGNIRHSVCRWCYSKVPADKFYPAIKDMGVTAVDLVGPSEFAELKRYDIVCSMVNNPVVEGLGGISRAWNRTEHHDRLVTAYEQRLAETAAAGYERLICFSGNRAGLDDEQGLANCAAGLKRIMATAERLKVTVCMELLNSKVNHKDYQFDRTAWGVELVKRVGSERFKLLYDIYHMQVQEGDICATIKASHTYIDHYHTAGVPGRNEIDETQELNYPRIMRAILETGFRGYVAQEFNPKNADPLASLRRSFEICDI